MLREIVSRARAWLVGLFRPPRLVDTLGHNGDSHELVPIVSTPPEPETIPPFPAFPEPAPIDVPSREETPAPPKAKREYLQRDVGASFIYFEDILEQIPACRDVMHALRQVDQDAYDYFREVGAKILPWPAADERLARWATFAEKWPARGMVYYPDRDTKNFEAVLMYYAKLDKLQPHLRVTQKDAVAVYRLTLAYYDKKPHKVPFAYSYAVSVNAAGEGSVVSERHEEYQRLPVPKNRNLRRYDSGGFTYMTWGTPSQLKWHFRDFTKRRKLRGESNDGVETVEAFGLRNFQSAAAIHAEIGKEFQVRAARDGVTVGFSVALGRTPYFFKDRQTEITTDGKRKRIFHRVEEHQRTYRSGKVATIPAHYRGERHFTWKGEAISVAPPEQSEIHFTAEGYEEDAPKDIVMASSKEVAATMTKIFEYDRRKRA